jgi:hypothetical protein
MPNFFVFGLGFFGAMVAASRAETGGKAAARVAIVLLWFCDEIRRCSLFILFSTGRLGMTSPARQIARAAGDQSRPEHGSSARPDRVGVFPAAREHAQADPLGLCPSAASRFPP